MMGETDRQPPDEGGEPPADPSRRKAEWLIRLVAAGCFVVGGLDLGLYLFQSHRNHSSVSFLGCLEPSIPLVLGVILLVKTSALADWIEEWLEQ